MIKRHSTSHCHMSFSAVSASVSSSGIFRFFATPILFSSERLSSDCTYPGCKCTAKRVDNLFQAQIPEHIVARNAKELALTDCRLVRQLEMSGGEPEGNQKNCLLKEQLEAASTGFLDNAGDGKNFSLYTVLERRRKLTLAGEGGKLVGTQNYWSPVDHHLAQNRNKSFSIFSIGGGQGHDVISIQNLFQDQMGLSVSQALSIDTNPLAQWMNSQMDGPVRIQDAAQFLASLTPRNQDELRVFHLGNFLSVLRPNAGSAILKQLYSKMEKGDVASILCITSEQFADQRKVQPKEESHENGLQEYSKGGTFFRTAISNPNELAAYLDDLGFSNCSFKTLTPEPLDFGPNNYKMFFVALIAIK